jgi:hypothetical protein
METDPDRAELPPEPEAVNSAFDADADESDEVHAPADTEVARAAAGRPPKHRREFLRILGTMTFLTAGLDKLGAAQGTPPACGHQPVEGGPAAGDLFCSSENSDADCGLPMAGGGFHHDNDCGKPETILGQTGASDDSDCTVSNSDNDCGMVVPGWSEQGHQDNDCGPGFSQGGDGDCGIMGEGGVAHTDEECSPTSTDSDCGMTTPTGGVGYDEDCTNGMVPSDSDCSRISQQGANGDGDCSWTGRDSDCVENDIVEDPPKNPNAPLPPVP